MGGGIILLVPSITDLPFSDTTRRSPSDAGPRELGGCAARCAARGRTGAIITIRAGELWLRKRAIANDGCTANLLLVLLTLVFPPALIAWTGASAAKAVSKVASLFLAAIPVALTCPVALICTGVAGIIAHVRQKRPGGCSLDAAFVSSDRTLLATRLPSAMPAIRYCCLSLLAAYALLAAAGCANKTASDSTGFTAQELEQEVFRADSINRDVPYVPTSMNVVDNMLELAGVTNDDVVYDLGSGDGRIVIRAAEKYGARGVGIEIDKELVEEARQNADSAGVADRVTFRQGDLFDADIGEATVVTLYLLPTINLRLRPKLFEELAPGTRVVSHDFDMDEWEHEERIEVGSSAIYFWTIPEEVPTGLQQ